MFSNETPNRSRAVGYLTQKIINRGVSYGRKKAKYPYVVIVSIVAVVAIALLVLNLRPTPTEAVAGEAIKVKTTVGLMKCLRSDVTADALEKLIPTINAAAAKRAQEEAGLKKCTDEVVAMSNYNKGLFPGCLEEWKKTGKPTNYQGWEADAKSWCIENDLNGYGTSIAEQEVAGEACYQTCMNFYGKYDPDMQKICPPLKGEAPPATTKTRSPIIVKISREEAELKKCITELEAMSTKHKNENFPNCLEAWKKARKPTNRGWESQAANWCWENNVNGYKTTLDKQDVAGEACYQKCMTFYGKYDPVMQNICPPIRGELPADQCLI